MVAIDGTVWLRAEQRNKEKKARATKQPSYRQEEKQ